ncbi:MAG: PHP domain-containing protein, partial [Candidatus Eremiobacteraeota bacterium]|nr:PHP domain-containing protein [Candidatus Eremiobacteraeota bacterium]
MLVDFHCHTFESDGTLSPFELTAAMKRRGVGIFSITDHDTLGAYDALRPGGTDDPQLAPMQLIAGIEINTTYRGNEVHVLGYGFEPGPGPLQTLVEENRVARNERAAKMVEQLQAAGYEITMDRVLAETPAGSGAPPLGRPHVAKALVRMGAV